MRAIFITAGLGSIAASAWMSVRAAGGLESEAAPGLIAIAIVLTVGSAAIGKALSMRAYALAACLCVGMIAGEVAAMISTAQRVATARVAVRSPIAAQEAARDAALSRLQAADAALTKASDARREQAALAGCKIECAKLLSAAVTEASAERDAARMALVRLPAASPSATPLADATGWPQWLIDLAEALAIGLAVNVPASALLALGVRMGDAGRNGLQTAVDRPAAEAGQQAEAQLVPALPESPALPVLAALAPPGPSPEIEAREFLREHVVVDAAATIAPPILATAYVAWAARAGRPTLPLDVAGRAILAELRGWGAVFTDQSIGGVRLTA